MLERCWEEDEAGEGDWAGVSLANFTACPHNLAPNRQTRMLADLALVNCYNTTGQVTILLVKYFSIEIFSISSIKFQDPVTRDRIMLNSAKANLANMAYFGLTEEQEISQYLFEETFNLRFKTDFDQLNRSDTHSGHSLDKLDDAVIEKIRNLNHLDLELYKYAKILLKDRFDMMKESDESFEEHIDEVKKEKEFSWDDIEDENYDSTE